MFPLRGCLLQVQCGHADKTLGVSKRNTGFSVQIQSTGFPNVLKPNSIPQSPKGLDMTQSTWLSPRVSGSVGPWSKNLHFWSGAAGATSLGNHIFKTPVLRKVLTDLLTLDIQKPCVHQDNPECPLPLEKASRIHLVPTKAVTSLFSFTFL